MKAEVKKDILMRRNLMKDRTLGKQEGIGVGAPRPTIRARCTNCQISFKCFLSFFGQTVQCPLCEKHLTSTATGSRIGGGASSMVQVRNPSTANANSDNGESAATATCCSSPKVDTMLGASGSTEPFTLKAYVAESTAAGGTTPSKVTSTDRSQAADAVQKQPHGQKPKQLLPEDVLPEDECRPWSRTTVGTDGDTTVLGTAACIFGSPYNAPTATPASATKETKGSDQLKELLFDQSAADVNLHRDKAQRFTMTKDTLDANKKNLNCEHPPTPMSCRHEEEPMHVDVPDPDFYDFDKDRSPKSSFHPGDIWAVYDDADSMPRWYVKLREVLSHVPFTVDMAFLTSRTTTEFSITTPITTTVKNWIREGFTKSCGSFVIGRYETRHNCLPMFSHKARWQKLPQSRRGLGAFIWILPRTGDVWAFYRDWAPDWDCHTPDEVVRRYELVEVVQEDYAGDELAVVVAPIMKVDGYTAVYRRCWDMEGFQRVVCGQEMLRFSHRVPARLLTGEEGNGAPVGLWQLDPAALSPHLLKVDHESPEPQAKLKKSHELEEEQGEKPIVPAAEGPVLDEPATWDPVFHMETGNCSLNKSASDYAAVDEPAASDNVLIDLAVQCPAVDERVAGEPVDDDEPAVDDLVLDEPVVKHPYLLATSNTSLDEGAVTNKPAAEVPSLDDLTASDSSFDEPAVGAAAQVPSLNKPAASDSSSYEPALGDASIEDPVVSGASFHKLAVGNTSHKPEVLSRNELVASDASAVDDSSLKEPAAQEPSFDRCTLEDPVLQREVDNSPNKPAPEYAAGDDLLAADDSAPTDLAAATDHDVDELAVDDLVPDELACKESALEDSGVDNLVPDAPALKGSTLDKPAVEDPAVYMPTVEIPSLGELAPETASVDKLEVGHVDPAAEDIVPVQPADQNSLLHEPAANDRVSDEPALKDSDLALDEPALKNSALGDPAAKVPVVDQPTAAVPSFSEQAANAASLEKPEVGDGISLDVPASDDSDVNEPVEEISSGEIELLLNSCPKEKLAALLLHSCPMEKLVALFLHSCPVEKLATLIQDMACTNPDVLNRVNAMVTNPGNVKVSSAENHVRTAVTKGPVLRKRLRNRDGAALVTSPGSVDLGLPDTPPSKSRKYVPSP